MLYAFPRDETAPGRPGAGASGDGEPGTGAPPAGEAPATPRVASSRVAASDVAASEPARSDAAADPAAPERAPFDGPRLGLSVSRRVGGAVERSRVKRLLREAFWTEASRLPSSSDYVVVARPELLGLAERDGLAGVRRALGELVDGLGGGSGSAEAA